MGIQYGVRWNKKDLKKFRQKLNALDKTGKVSKNVLNQEVKYIVGKMKKEVPVDTGRLKNSIKAYQDPYGAGGVTFVSSAIDPNSGDDYAPKVEHGTRWQKAQPYFFKNIRLFNKRIVRKLGDALTKLILRDKITK